MTLAELAAAFALLCGVPCSPPDLGVVQPTPERQELASLADRMRDYAQSDERPWVELPEDARRIIESVWDVRR